MFKGKMEENLMNARQGATLHASMKEVRVLRCDLFHVAPQNIQQWGPALINVGHHKI